MMKVSLVKRAEIGNAVVVCQLLFVRQGTYGYTAIVKTFFENFSVCTLTDISWPAKQWTRPRGTCSQPDDGTVSEPT